MPLLNYTTEVPVTRTVLGITKALAEAGASRIATDYGPGGQPVGVAFEFTTSYGSRSYVLPVDAAAVAKVLAADRKVEPRFKTPEQAERVAWRILKDWIEAQAAIIQTRMVTLDQVFLPYMADPQGRTAYELYRDSQMAALPAGDPS